MSLTSSNCACSLLALASSMSDSWDEEDAVGTVPSSLSALELLCLEEEPLLGLDAVLVLELALELDGCIAV